MKVKENMANKKTETKKAAAKKTTANEKPVKTTTGELVVMDNEDKDILAGISQDLDNGDIGKFYHFRGCVALVLLKERCPHGLYESTTAEAMPNRSSRTLCRYYSEGKKFLADNNMNALETYNQLRSFDPVKALGQTNEGRLLIGSGGADESQAADVPPAVDALVKKINEKIEEKINSGVGKKPPKQLSKSQKREAAASDLTLAVGKVNVAMSSDWSLVDTETLDIVASAFTLAAATIREELKKRG